jgi:hypothetical protein
LCGWRIVCKKAVSSPWVHGFTIMNTITRAHASGCAGHFQLPARAPDASTLESVAPAEAPAPRSPYRACPCARFSRTVTAVPIPSRARSLTCSCITTLREGCIMRARLCMRACASDCECERKTHAQPHSSALTGWVGRACTYRASMPHGYDDPCGLAHARTPQQAYE